MDEDPLLNENYFELLRLKDDYRMKKLFPTKYDEKSAADLATLRFKIRMIQEGIK